MSNWKVDDRGIPNIWQKRWKALRKELRELEMYHDNIDRFDYMGIVQQIQGKMTEITRKIK